MIGNEVSKAIRLILLGGILASIATGVAMMLSLTLASQIPACKGLSYLLLEECPSTIKKRYILYQFLYFSHLE